MFAKIKNIVKFLLIINSFVININSSSLNDSDPVEMAYYGLDEKPVDYSHHKLLRIEPKLNKHVNDLIKLGDQFKIDYWNHPMSDKRPVLTLLSPGSVGKKFLLALNNSRIPYECKSSNFQKLLDRERTENEMNKKSDFGLLFNYDSTYHRYEEIVNELSRISKNNTRINYNIVGKTYEGRDIPYVTITDPDSKSLKTTVFFECGIHAREWISTATCLWISNQLLSDPANEGLLKKFEFLIIPTMNPDGYVYTHTINRMWRKTRSPQQNGHRGADPNRNFDSHFGQAGVQKDPSGEAYCGTKPFSEVETRALANLILAKRGNIGAYFSIHSYSQLWMYPYGYSYAQPSNYAQLEKLSSLAVEAIRATNGLVFNKGTIARTIYRASGSSTDWAYDSAGVKVAFALELRDKGHYGFVLPPHQIKAAATEAWAGIKAVLTHL